MRNVQGDDVGPMIVVLGASGAVGLALSEELIRMNSGRIRLVDVDAAPCRGLAGDRVEIIETDVFRTGEADAVLDGADLLVNCLSLVYFDRVFDMAVQAGIDYTDLISEPSNTQIKQAEDRGILAVPGLGISPGLTNVLVAHAAQDMTVIEVDIMFALFRSIAPSRGALDTALWEGGEYSPERNFYRDGELVPAGPFDGRRRYDFGGEVGSVDLYYRPHPEPKSLPKNFPTIRFAAVHGTWQPELMNDLKVLNKYGFLSKENVERSTEVIWSRLGGENDTSLTGKSALVVEVCGALPDGHGIVRTYGFTKPSREATHSYALTGSCAAVGVHLIARHGRTRVGVAEPESYFDPTEYVALLTEGGYLAVSWSDAEWTDVTTAGVDVHRSTNERS